MRWARHSRHPALFVQHARADGDADHDVYLDAHGYSDGNGNRHAYAHGDGHSDGNGNTYTHGNGNPDGNADPDANTHPYTVAHADPDPTAPANFDADAGLCHAHGNAGPGIARAVGPGHARRERLAGRQRDV